MEYKIVVSGEDGSGKSSLVIRFVQNWFVDDGYDNWMEDSFRKMITLDDEVVLLDILDTFAEQEEFSAMRDQYFRQGAGFIVTYSISSMSDFESARDRIDQILRVKDSDWVPMILVGTKCDLADNHREVSEIEGMNLAALYDCVFLETSARNSINVEEAFFELVRQIRFGVTKNLVQTKIKMLGVPIPFTGKQYVKINAPPAPVIPIRKESTNLLLHDVKTLLHPNPPHSDTKIKCADGTLLAAHACILSARSPWFKNAIAMHCKPDQRKPSALAPILLHCEFSAECMTKIIECLYLGPAAVFSYGDIVLHRLEEAAAVYGPASLVSRCKALRKRGDKRMTIREQHVTECERILEAERERTRFRAFTNHFASDEQISTIKNPPKTPTTPAIEPLEAIHGLTSSAMLAGTPTFEDVDASLSDISILVPGANAPILAHKCILAARDPHFAALLESGMADSDNTVELAATPEAVRVLKSWIYGHTLSQVIQENPAMAYELMGLADMHCIKDEHLTQVCESSVSKVVSASTLTNIMQASFILSATHLQNFCTHYAAFVDYQAFQSAPKGSVTKAMRDMVDERHQAYADSASKRALMLSGQASTRSILGMRIRRAPLKVFPDGGLPWYRKVVASH